MYIKHLFLLIFFCCSLSYAGTPGEVDSRFFRPLYIGIMGGYGSTTWNGLVPAAVNQNEAMSFSVPTSVQEGGGVWGLMGGFEFMPSLALEASYMHFPDAQVNFAPLSLFSFTHNEQTQFTTRTETMSLVAKLMVVIPNTPLRIFSSVGGAGVHRDDILAEEWLLSPTFGFGLNYRMTRHIMAELAFNYTAGYGESQLSPTDTYLPFLYATTFRLAYFF